MYTYAGGLNGFPQNNGEVTLKGYDSSLNESSSSGNGIHLMEFWQKGSNGRLKQSKTFPWGEGWLFSTNKGKDLLLKTILIQCIETWKSRVGIYLGPLALLTSVHWAERYFVPYQKKRVTTNPATNPSICKGDLTVRCTSVVVAQSFCNQPISN